VCRRNCEQSVQASPQTALDNALAEYAGVTVVETLEGALETVRKLVQTFPDVAVTADGAGVTYANRDGEEIIHHPRCLKHVIN
jgi:hypothetical protein